jgi:bacterioferritin
MPRRVGPVVGGVPCRVVVRPISKEPAMSTMSKMPSTSASASSSPPPGAAAAAVAGMSDVQTLRSRARQHIEEGAVTDSYGADRETVLRLLNEALATEIVCSLRYRRHYYMARGLTSLAIADEFIEHAHEEEAHADRFAERIAQLGGEPDFSPDSLTARSHAEYVEGDTIVDMITEDLVAERIAIDSYKEIVAYLGSADPTTRRLFEEVLAVEEQHAEELQMLIQQIGPDLARSRRGAGGAEATVS